MKIRNVTLAAVLLMTTAVTGYSQNFFSQQTDRFIPTPPINSPIKDPFVRRESYSSPSFPGSNTRPQGQPLGTTNRNMRSGGNVNINNFQNPNGTIFNPNTVQPRMLSNTQAGQVQPKLYSSTPAGQQRQAAPLNFNSPNRAPTQARRR